MFVYRTHGVVAATLGVLALGACDDPELNTDLRPEGPPEVLAVLVMTDSSFQLVEQAVYCKPGDELRPTLVGLPDFTTQEVCPEEGDPDPIDNAYPDGWYIRIMFDELLDPSIEELSPIIDSETGEPTGAFTGSIAAANPVTLECQSVVNNAYVNVSYDGYYSPAGNRVTWPVGPSLVIKPNDPTLIATGKQCRVTINPGAIRDKQGEEVAAAQVGPFEFGIAPIEILAIDPSDGGEVDALQIYYDNIYVQFNTAVDPSSFCDEGTSGSDCEFALSPEVGECSVSGTACNPAMTGADCPTVGEDCDFGGYYAYPFGADLLEYGFGPVYPIETGTATEPKEYSFSFTQGGMIADRCGAVTTFGAPDEGDQTLITFLVEAFGPRGAGFNIANNEVASPNKKPSFQFNNVVDWSTLDLTEWTLTPEPFIRAVDETAGGVCTTNADCVDDAGEGVVDATLWQRDPAGGECRDFGAPINAKRCVNRYATSLYNDGNYKLRGIYQLDTTYTFTLKAGATVSDYYGATYTNEEDVVVTWKTSPAITLGSITPANNAEVGLGDPTDPVNILMPFNQAMDVTTLTEGTDFTITGGTVTGLTIGVGSEDGGDDDVNGPNADCSETGTACKLRVTGVFAPGTYTFTLKAGAQIEDLLGNVYTHPADTVRTFTVANDPPSPGAQCL